MLVDIRKASRYLKGTFEQALYEAAKCSARHIDPYRNFPRVFEVFNSALDGYWALIGEGQDEPETLRDFRIRIQKKIAEKFHVGILGDGRSGLYGLVFSKLDLLEEVCRFEYGKDYRVTREAKFEWLNPRAYGGTPEPEEVGNDG